MRPILLGIPTFIAKIVCLHKRKDDGEKTYKPKIQVTWLISFQHIHLDFRSPVKITRPIYIDK